MSTPLKSYSHTAVCCAIEKAQYSAYTNLLEMNRDLLDWTPSCGLDELVKKLEGIKAEADLLLFRVRPLINSEVTNAE